MNRRHVVTGIFALCLLAASASAAVRAAQRDDASLLFALSGAEHQLSSVGETTALQFESQAGQIPAEIRAPMSRALRRAYDPAALRRVALRRIRRGIDDPRGHAALHWLRSDLGRRITRLEEAASTPAGMAELPPFAAQLKSNPPSALRIAQVERLESATRGIDLALEATVRTASAVTRALSAAYPVAASPGDLEAAVEAQRGQLREQIRRMLFLSFLYTYRDLSDDELSAYVTFLQSAPGRWYQDLLNDAIGEAMDAGAHRLDQALREEMAEPSLGLR